MPRSLQQCLQAWCLSGAASSLPCTQLQAGSTDPFSGGGAPQVFSYNDPETLLMAVHPSGKNILGEGNLAFMHGPPHKAIRRSFLSLFTRKALATYVEVQDAVIRRFLNEWLQTDGEREIRPFVR